ncbi:MAG: hypothetical protein ACOYIK_00900 [Coriobacteriales bacterium]|jgi:hypothetical protein
MTSKRMQLSSRSVFTGIFSLVFALGLLAFAPGSAFAADTENQQYNEAEDGSAAEEEQAKQADSSDITTYEITDLVNGGTAEDNLTVSVSGEVVGEIINADSSHKWIALSQDGETVSVYVRNSDAEQIQHLGKYGETGDTVTVTGTFHLDCSAHQGDMDIHAVSFKIVSSGGATMEEPDIAKLRIAVILLVVGLAVGFTYWRLRERMR